MPIDTQTPEEKLRAETTAKGLGYKSVSDMKDVLGLSSANGEKIANNLTIDVNNRNQQLLKNLEANQQRAREKSLTPPPETLPPEVQVEVDAGKTPEQKATEELTKQRNEALTNVFSSFEGLALANTQQTQAMIGTLTSQYNERRKQLEQSNKVMQAVMTQSGIRSGATRYATEINQGILTDTEQQGIQRLQELDSKYASAIAEANSALSQKNFTLAKEKNDYAIQIQDKFLTEMDKRAKEAMVVNKDINEKNLKLKKEAEVKAKQEVDLKAKQEASDFISDAFASGTTNVNDIYRQARLSGIKIDPKDIASVVKDFQVVEKTAPGVVGEWLALKENDPEMKDLTLEGYLNMKDPTRALDIKEKILKIKEMEKKLEDMPGAIIGADEKIIPTAKDARLINKELTTKDEFKVIRKGQDSLQFLLDFEKAFDKYGLQTIPGKGKGELSTKYQTTLLNLKEFFNLGVLNGPDLVVLEGILPNPTKMPEIFGFIPVSKKLSGVKSKVTEGIKALKENISKTLDDRYTSLSTQYGDYSPEAINGLKDLNRIYIQQKTLLNPEIKKIINENPELTDEEIIQIIQNK